MTLVLSPGWKERTDFDKLPSDLYTYNMTYTYLDSHRHNVMNTFNTQIWKHTQSFIEKYSTSSQHYFAHNFMYIQLIDKTETRVSYYIL